MCDLLHPAVTMPPFPSSLKAPRFVQTAPLPQRPFAPVPGPMRVSSHSSSSAYSGGLPFHALERPPSKALVVANPQLALGGAPSPVDRGFAFTVEDRKASVANLTLAPLTCPESTILIAVDGDGKCQKFPVHRDLLCSYSPYFRRLLSDSKVVTARIRRKNHRREWRWEDKESVDEVMSIGGSADSEDTMDVNVVINLPSVVHEAADEERKTSADPETRLSGRVRELKLDTEELGVDRTVFAAFVNWLYHGYPGFGLFHPLDQHLSFDASTLIQLWVFAGRIGVPECQNHCVEGIEWCRTTSNIIQTSMLAWVYENTEEYDGGKCGVRALLIDQCAWKLDGHWLLREIDGRKNEDQFPRQALVDLVGRMRVVLNDGARPPFSHSESRKAAYWIPAEEKKVGELSGE